MTKQNKHQILAIACIIFFALGLITAALGPILPELSQQTGASLAEVGAIFTAIFLGALLAQVVSGPLGDRYGQRIVLLGGLLLMGAGTLAFTLGPSLVLVLAMAFLAGFGHGAIDLGGNVLIARVFEARSVSALNLLNLFFGAGAFAGPALVSVSWKILGGGMPVLWMAAGLMFLLALPLLRMAPALKTQPIVKQTAAQTSSLYRSPLLWMLGVLLLLYVGTENGIGGWTTTYMDRTTPIGISNAALVTSGFWLALTGGRLVSVIAGRWLRSFTLLVTSLAGAAVGGLLMALSTGSTIPSIAAIVLIGFGFGSIYPTTIAITTEKFPNAPGKAASVAAAMGSVGGMLLPWQQGVLLDRVGVNASAWFVALGTLAMLALAVRIQYNRRSQQVAPSLST